MIYNALLFLHLIICVALVLVVLLQSGKGGGLAGAFGGGMGGAGQTLFGGRGAATFLSKTTTVLGIAFMTSSLLLAILSGGQGDARSILRESQFTPGVSPPPAGDTQPVQIPSQLPPVQGGEAAPGAQAPAGDAPSPGSPPEPAEGGQETGSDAGGNR